MRAPRRMRGESGWKLLLGIAAGVGAVWVFAQSSLPAPEPPSRAVAGPIALGPPVANNEPRAAAASTKPAPAPAATPQNDPFAGVDLSNNSVLRHIAGIDESARNRQQRAQQRGAPATAARLAPEAVRPPAPAPAVVQVRAEPTVTPQATLSPAAEAVVTLPPPAADQTHPQTRASDAPATRQSPETLASMAPPVERQAVSPAAPTPAETERTQVAALGNVPPAALAPAAQLRVIARPAPPFPVEAMRAGIQQGRVVARLTIEADGRVSSAQILSSVPLGYFERESRRALANWRYEPPGRQTSADVELVFNRE